MLVHLDEQGEGVRIDQAEGCKGTNIVNNCYLP